MRGWPRDLVADRVQQVGLAEAHAAVDEERVVGLARRSATAWQAAWANWLELPTTKDSNV